MMSAVLCLLVLPPYLASRTDQGLGQSETASSDSELIREIIRTTEPLEEPRGERLPLYIWPAHRLGTHDERELESLIRQLDDRGIAVLSSWEPDREDGLDDVLRLGRIQKRLGSPISINATACMYTLFNGDLQTAHIDEEGRPFFDSSFGAERKMGCPFALDYRLPDMKRRIEEWVKAYKEAGLDIRLVYADWEIDGPIEWNGAWEASQRCVRCRKNIPNIEDFGSFQEALRRKRSELQKAMLADSVRTYFPHALVGNYGVYPHDGYRYWYDYFEEFVEGAPYRADGRARYRQWFHEFPLTGYTVAMPTVYPWYDIHGWYDFDDSDFRWFYNMLLVGSNAGESTSPDTPIITFVHWHTTEPPENPDPAVQQFSREKYTELLWHLLLRGHDGFFVWSPRAEALEESQLVHRVYAASHPYRDFLAEGIPVTFAVPRRPGPVVSGLRLGNRLLVRRTDFDAQSSSVTLVVDGQTIDVPRAEGRCQVLDLKD